MALSIRRSKYRGYEGFTLFGIPKGQVGGWPVKIFDLDRQVLEQIREAYEELEGDALRDRVRDLLLGERKKLKLFGR